jgi:hypothetical protein
MSELHRQDQIAQTFNSKGIGMIGILYGILGRPTIRWESERQFFGKPLISIAFGPDTSAGENFGHARGVVAIGEIAVGFVAIGTVLSYGVLSFGFISLGVLTFCGIGLGAVCFGGLAVGGIAVGGAAVGIVALGGMAIGYIGFGGLSIGYYSVGEMAIGKYIITEGFQDPIAVEFLDSRMPWLMNSIRATLLAQ